MARTTTIACALLFSAVLGAACREEKAPTRAEAASTGRRDRWIAVAPPPESASAAAIAREAEESGTPAAAGEATPPVDVLPMSPLADAAVGEWARYRTHLGWAQQYRVTSVSADTVYVEVRVVGESGPLGMPATRPEPTDIDWALHRAKTHKAVVTAADARIEAAGRSWDCRLTVARFERGGVAYEQRTWMCLNACLYGLVKSETVHAATDEVVAGMTLTAFGDGGMSRVSGGASGG